MKTALLWKDCAPAWNHHSPNPAPLCWLEREGHEFADYLARTIKVR